MWQIFRAISMETPNIPTVDAGQGPCPHWDRPSPVRGIYVQMRVALHKGEYRRLEWNRVGGWCKCMWCGARVGPFPHHLQSLCCIYLPKHMEALLYFLHEKIGHAPHTNSYFWCEWTFQIATSIKRNIIKNQVRLEAGALRIEAKKLNNYYFFSN